MPERFLASPLPLLRHVKRALPYDWEYPRERFESTRDVMIVVDFTPDEQFLRDLRHYFSSYGPVYACKRCHETDLDYILVEFADPGRHRTDCLRGSLSSIPLDQVDRVILDRPHYLHECLLHVMKCIPSNKTTMKKKLCSSMDAGAEVMITRDASDDNDGLHFGTGDQLSTSDLRAESRSEVELEAEVQCLQTTLKKMNEDFVVKRKRLEDDCCEQLTRLNDNAHQTHRLQQDLEKGKRS